jgi:hypothetical protein
MFVFQRLFAAVARLTDAVTGLAATLETANSELQARLTLAGPTAAETAALPHQPAQDGPSGHEEGNGTSGRKARQRASQTA